MGAWLSPPAFLESFPSPSPIPPPLSAIQTLNIRRTRHLLRRARNQRPPGTKAERWCSRSMEIQIWGERGQIEIDKGEEGRGGSDGRC